MPSDTPPSTPHEPHVDLDSLLHHTALPETRLSRPADALIRRIGRLSSYLWVVLIGVIATNVILRYVIGKGLIEFEEAQWHLYAAGFMLALAWGVESDNHVRIDVFSEHFRFRTKCWIELVGIIVALIPFVAFVSWYALPLIAYSFSVNEVSEAPGGLPYRWAIKAFLFIGFALLALAALSRLSRVWAALFTRRAAGAQEG